LLRRNGFDYKAQAQRKPHWRKHHYTWLDTTIERCPAGLKTNLSLLLRQLKSLDAILAAYGEAVQALALTPRVR
jgi:hypothetical protein